MAGWINRQTDRLGPNVFSEQSHGVEEIPKVSRVGGWSPD